LRIDYVEGIVPTITKELTKYHMGCNRIDGQSKHSYYSIAAAYEGILLKALLSIYKSLFLMSGGTGGVSPVIGDI